MNLLFIHPKYIELLFQALTIVLIFVVLFILYKIYIKYLK